MATKSDVEDFYRDRDDLISEIWKTVETVYLMQEDTLSNEFQLIAKIRRELWDFSEKEMDIQGGSTSH